MTVHDTSAPMLDIPAARRLACDLIKPLTVTETLALARSLGRIAAETVTSGRALPMRERSAMDGFALRLADLSNTLSLPVAGTIAAGAPAGDLPTGAALRIFTGALVPAGADCVVPVEDCTEEGETIRLSARPKPGQHIRKVGSEQPLGGVLLRQGTRIAPQHIGLLAANGIARVRVLRVPRIALFSSGDELGGKGPAAIPDSNRPMLMALALAAGAEVDDLGILPDDLPAITARLTALAGRADIILTSGAVSMGGRDHLRPALEAAGGQIAGWRVALKPGKPVMFGTLGASVVTGLPGNPFSAFTGFHLFVAAQLATLTGQPLAPLFAQPARAGFDWVRKPGRAEVFPIRLSHGEIDGVPIVQRMGEGSSATLFPLAEADGLGFVPAETTKVSFGAALRFMPLGQRVF
ncbi:molybdopterin molybdotransferase MoeA [Rhodobacter maris]|uniref:Molybdopterin molybdenumtransferase n=1 Tax=Rhodobacter maris TaxID=446682 RepID=A0A285SS66_9RHOB|nr:gephyrin-like molybdotransferase Glp [Rhodobacter maris]SOC09117.1 molybdopterin molybdotransferase [Rhodobacter maris]